MTPTKSLNFHRGTSGFLQFLLWLWLLSPHVHEATRRHLATVTSSHRQTIYHQVPPPSLGISATQDMGLSLRERGSVPPGQGSHWCSGGCGVNFIFSFSVTHWERVSKTTAVKSMNTAYLPFTKSPISHKNWDIYFKGNKLHKNSVAKLDFSVLWSVFVKTNFCSWLF